MILDHHDHFFALVDALSAIRVLARLPVEEVAEEDFLRQSLDAVMAHQNVGQCSIFTAEDGVLHCAVGTGVDTFGGDEVSRQPESIQSMQFAPGEGIIGLAYQTGQIQYCRNCKTDPRFKPFERRALFYGDGSLLSVPVVSGEQVLGVLNVSHHLPEFFESWQQHFLVLFANTLGRLLHLHRMIHALGDEVAVRTRSLEQALEESDALRNRYQQLSIKDELTGLYNRRYFFAEGEAMLARAIRYESPLSLLLIDVDRFKQVNDTWGHTVGDQVLCHIADTLLSEARTGDLVARMGGEEFVLILPNTAPEGVDMMANRIQTQLASMGFGIVDQSIDLTVSIGITELGERSPSELRVQLEQLYHEADLAMYQCKLSGRNRRMLFTQAMEQLDHTPSDG